MLKNLESLKKIVENKGAILRNDIKLLDDFYNKADSNTQQLIDTFLGFHKALSDKTINVTSVSISIGRIVNEQTFNSILQSIVLDPAVMITNYQKKEPVIMIKNKNDCIVEFNLTDIKVVLFRVEKVNGKTYCFIQLHSNHNKIDYSIIVIAKEDK